MARQRYIGLTKQVLSNGGFSSIDYLYGPYSSITEGLKAVPSEYRALGRTIGIITDGVVKEYWFESGIKDSDLIPKFLDTHDIDKQFIIWFGTIIPTLANEPAMEWTTNYIKDMHIDDWYFIKTESVAGGLAYRFEKDTAGNYAWNNITDADTIAALTKAASAETIANGKIRNFVDTPAPPYSVGDLWTNANYTDGSNVLYTNDLLKCKVAKNTGDLFSISDWEPANAATTAYIKNMGDTVKIEILGKDAQGNLNTVLTSINADASGVKIHADKLAIDATVLANLIMASGLQVGVKDAQGNFTSINFEVTEDGYIKAKKADISGTIRANAIYTPYKFIQCNANGYTLNPVTDGTNVIPSVNSPSDIMILPDATTWDGLNISVLMCPFSMIGDNGESIIQSVILKSTSGFIYKESTILAGNYMSSGTQYKGYGLHNFVAVSGRWFIKDEDNANNILT